MLQNETVNDGQSARTMMLTPMLARATEDAAAAKFNMQANAASKP
jgi:hypothetical protein